MKKKIALITGASGQDGSYLAELLLNKNYIVISADRRSSRNNDWRMKALNLSVNKKLITEDIDLTDISSIIRIFRKYNFKEVYNLAAQSFVKSSFETPLSSCDVTAMGVLRILETIRLESPKTRFYQASSSEMFGKTYNNKQNEKTKLILTGTMCLIIFQALIHIGVNIRLFPTTGMTLPFLSYGGSSIVGVSILSGIILNLTKRKID